MWADLWVCAWVGRHGLGRLAEDSTVTLFQMVAVPNWRPN